MDTMLDTLRTIVRDRSRGIPDEDFTLRGLWSVDYRAYPTPYERFMTYSFVMAQAKWQGCCYADFGSVRLSGEVDALLGQDSREVRGLSVEEDIAILDAAFGSLPARPTRRHLIDGLPQDKALARARIVVDEAMALLSATGGRRVANVGVMGNLIHHLRAEDVEITASDFDPDLIAHGILGIPVVSGQESARLIAESDVALVCGETLPSHTLSALRGTAAEHGTRLVVFAVTGCHFAEAYCTDFGIDVVVSEPQPQYLFQGQSTIDVYRRRPG